VGLCWQFFAAQGVRAALFVQTQYLGCSVAYLLTASSLLFPSFLQAHLADPYHVTFATKGVSVPFLHN
jgi:hypothetical protein